MPTVIVGALSVAITWLIARTYYRKQTRRDRLADAAANSRHEELRSEVLTISQRLDPDRLLDEAQEPVTTSDGEEIVTSDGETVTVMDYEALASAYDRLGAPRMAEIVRRAGSGTVSTTSPCRCLPSKTRADRQMPSGVSRFECRRALDPTSPGGRHHHAPATVNRLPPELRRITVQLRMPVNSCLRRVGSNAMS